MGRRKMKAWVLESYRDMQLKDVDIPMPGEDEVLIENKAVCICNGSDPEIYNGHEAYTPPLVFGHEASGRIVEVGENVTDWHVGQRVCWWFTMGAFAEYSIVKPGDVAMFEVPDSISDEESPVLELAIAASRALMRVDQNCKGKRLAILGLGPSGLIALQQAKTMGFLEVWGWDLYLKRREVALSLGIDAVFDPSSSDFDLAIANLAEADIALDMMGDEKLSDSVFTKLLRKTRPSGTVISYGHPEHGRLFSPFVFQSRDLTMISPENRIPVIREKGEQFMKWVAEGKIQIGPMVTKVQQFQSLGDSFQNVMVNPGEQLKLVFKL